MNNFLRSFSVIVGIGFFLLTPVTTWAGTVTGVMQMKDGSPMAGGMVIIFTGDEGPPPQFSSEDIREPDFVEDLNNEGVFRIKLNAGTYYFGALQWLDGRGPGKPVKGDNFFMMHAQPVQVPAVGEIDLGVIAQGETIH